MKANEEKNKDKNVGRKADKLVVYENFISMLKKIAIKLLSDAKNYTNTLTYQLCHEEIRDLTTPNYCHLYTEDRKNFITFHFFCALKGNKAEKFQEIMNKFDFIFHLT